MVMMKGKKQTARRLLWDAFQRIRDAGSDPQEVFHTAIANAKPMMEMRTYAGRGQAREQCRAALVSPTSSPCPADDPPRHVSADHPSGRPHRFLSHSPHDERRV